MRLKDFFANIGLFKDDIQSYQLPYDVNEYKATDMDRINIHKALLEGLVKKEEERLTTIETKTSQIVTYTGIIFSALSLFVPILLDKITDHNLFPKIVFIIVLVLAFSFYALTIHNAIRNYNIRRFIYSRPSADNVIKYQSQTVEEFTAIEIRDLLSAHHRNSSTNNDKATNVIRAFRTFRLANFCTAIMGVLICISLLFSEPKDEGILLRSPVNIAFDSSFHAFLMKTRERDTFIMSGNKDTLIINCCNYKESRPD